LIKQLEQKLDSFNAAERKKALLDLLLKVTTGEIALPLHSTAVNLHCHTFFSYNSYGYSPSKFAWLARKAGLAVAGIVDFDVLDGLDEFLDAAKTIGLKSAVGIETRVFIPGFADKVINSPGEPGISYHMGMGFTNSKLTGAQRDFLTRLRQTAQQRNRDLTQRVNEFLKPVELDYEKDVLPLTPSGNPTERHICLAYARKAKRMFAEDTALGKFWSEKLGTNVVPFNLPESRELLNNIRAKTMKQGGAGYVKPDTGSFPKLDEMNQFILATGAIPVMTWLDGTSDGEQDIERLLDVEMKTGVAAINIIPDRNYTSGVKNPKLANLYHIVELAESRNLPVVVGTEMNSPGQKFVDSFETAELKPLIPVFLKGAYIIYAHSVLQQTCGLGYLSDWAKKSFSTAAEKNEFFEKFGRLLKPPQQDIFIGLTENITPEQVLRKIVA
jgi:hypothetical protein